MKPVDEPVASLELELTINGEPVRQVIPARLLLADLLRDVLGLTGTHVGCEHGGCGACTVLLDGAPALACLTLAAQVDGLDVVTVEGVTPSEGLNEMQAAFKEHHALQCGFCTPGLLMTLAGSDPRAFRDEQRIRELLSGNLCRCTGYDHIVAAVCSVWGVNPEN